MGAVPTARQFVAGETETATYMNSVSAAVNFLLDPPRAQVYSTASLSLTNAAYTILTWNNEQYDTDGMHDLVTNTSRLTAATPGLYEVSIHLPIAANATGNRYVNFYQNGVALSHGAFGGAATATTFILEAEIEVYAAVGDYLEIGAYQNSGAALTTSVAAGYRPIYKARWVARS